MVDYPYTIKPSTLEDFLKKKANRPEPNVKVTMDYLKNWVTQAAMISKLFQF